MAADSAKALPTGKAASLSQPDPVPAEGETGVEASKTGNAEDLQKPAASLTGAMIKRTRTPAAASQPGAAKATIEIPKSDKADTPQVAADDLEVPEPPVETLAAEAALSVSDPDDPGSTEAETLDDLSDIVAPSPKRRALSWSDVLLYTSCYLIFLFLTMFFLDVLPIGN